IFTPSSKVLNEHQVLAPHAILSVNHNKTAILTLLNTSTSTKIIPKGIKLGYIRCWQDDNHSYSNLTQNQHHISTISSGSPTKKTTNKLNNDIYNLIVHLPNGQQQQIYSILNKHKSVFDTSTPSVMKTNNIFHRIPVKPHHQPTQSYPYRKSA